MPSMINYCGVSPLIDHYSLFTTSLLGGWLATPTMPVATTTTTTAMATATALTLLLVFVLMLWLFLQQQPRKSKCENRFECKWTEKRRKIEKEKKRKCAEVRTLSAEVEKEVSDAKEV